MQQETGELFTDAHYYNAIIQPAGYNKQINLYLYSLPIIVISYTLPGAYSIYANSKKIYMLTALNIFRSCNVYLMLALQHPLAQSQQELQHGMSLTGRPFI